MFSLSYAQASSEKFPKSYQGTWISKPTYIGFMKHIKKNIAIPSMKFYVHERTAKWCFTGYLPKGYNHSAHTLKIKKVQKNFYTLSGTGPYGNLNYFAKIKKTLHYAYQHGGEITLFRRK